MLKETVNQDKKPSLKMLSLKGKLTLIFMGIISSMIIVNFLLQEIAIDRQKEMIINDFGRSSTVMADLMKKEFKVIHSEIKSLALNGALVSKDGGAIAHIFNKFIHLKQNKYRLFVYLDPDGSFISSNNILYDKTEIDVDDMNSIIFDDLPWFQDIVTSKFSENQNVVFQPNTIIFLAL